MIESITAAIGTAKATIDLFSTAKKITSAAELSEVIVAANSNIAAIQQGLLEAQGTIYELMKEKSEIEAQLIKASEWEDAKKAYELWEVRSGVFVYYHHAGPDGSGRPTHTACPNCFSKKKISILQQPNNGNEQTKCFECGFLVDFSAGSPPPMAVYHH